MSGDILGAHLIPMKFRTKRSLPLKTFQLRQSSYLFLRKAENTVPVVGRGLLDKGLALAQIGIGGTVIRTFFTQRFKEPVRFLPIAPVKHAMGFLKPL